MIEVCGICGDRGFSNALLDCSECSDAVVHQYCLGLAPGSIDDTFDWFCERCSVLMEFESCGKFGGGVSKSGREDLETESSNEIVLSPEQPEPLCALLPMQYERSFPREKTSNLSQKHEESISSFMEHPDSIMRGLILLVSPSGEIFIDGEENSNKFSYFSSLAGHILNMTSRSKKSGTYKVKRESPPLGKTAEKYVNSAETLGVDGRKHRSLSEINACLNNNQFNENEDTASPEVLSDNSVGSSLKDLRRAHKRNLEPEEEVIQRKKASSYKVESDSEEDRDSELSFGAAMAEKQRLVRDQIVTMLLDAGWTVENRPRSGINKVDKVYISPNGHNHWSIPSAYLRLERDVEKAKASNSEVAYGSGNSGFCFKPLPEELLSLLGRKFKQEKKWMNERKS